MEMILSLEMLGIEDCKTLIYWCEPWVKYPNIDRQWKGEEETWILKYLWMYYTHFVEMSSQEKNQWK